MPILFYRIKYLIFSAPINKNNITLASGLINFQQNIPFCFIKCM